MKKIKVIFLNGNIYEFYSFKYGIYLNVNEVKSDSYFNNVRDAINWMYEYDEFVVR